MGRFFPNDWIEIGRTLNMNIKQMSTPTGQSIIAPHYDHHLDRLEEIRLNQRLDSIYEPIDDSIADIFEILRPLIELLIIG